MLTCETLTCETLTCETMTCETLWHVKHWHVKHWHVKQWHVKHCDMWNTDMWNTDMWDTDMWDTDMWDTDMWDTDMWNTVTCETLTCETLTCETGSAVEEVDKLLWWWRCGATATTLFACTSDYTNRSRVNCQLLQCREHAITDVRKHDTYQNKMHTVMHETITTTRITTMLLITKYCEVP